MLRAIAKGPETLAEDPAALFPGAGTNRNEAGLVAAE
jgi:cytochrome d ubiquinol oxidase subunit I